MELNGQLLENEMVVKKSLNDSDKLNEEIARQKLRIRNAIPDTEKVKLLNQVSMFYSLRNYDSGVKYSEQALLLASRSNDYRGLVIANLRRGYMEEELKKNWDLAIVYYQKALTAAKYHKLDDMLDDVYSIIHNACIYQGNFPMAMNIARDGFVTAEKRGDRIQMLHYQSLIANSYFRQNLYNRAQQEFLKAERLAIEMEKDGIQAINLITLADIHYGLGNVLAAAGDSGQSLHYLEMASEGFWKMRRNPAFIRGYMIPNTLYKKGLVYHLSGDYSQSLAFATAALDSCKTISCNLYEMAGYYLLAGDACRALGDYALSRDHLYEGKRIAEQIRHAEDIRDAYKYLAVFYAGQAQYDSAWLYQQQYTTLKDSITNEGTRYRTEEINALYGIAEMDRKITHQRNQRNILVASFIFLLLTLVLIYSRYRLRQRNIYQRELNRQQNELFNAISLAQEQERKRIAQDIHDSLGSILSAAKLKLAQLKEEMPYLAGANNFISSMSLMDEASAELRSISHNIMPATLSKLGLVPALKNLTEKISSHKGLIIKFMAHDFENRIDEQSEISIYRIVLELINNIVKHATATTATVQLVRYPDYINITVEDNGKGFNVSKVLHFKTGIGLGSVQARVAYLKGKIDIDSNPGKGTTVILEIPVAG